MYGSSTHITVGVLLLGNAVQLSDLDAVDLISMLSTEAMSVLPASADSLKVLAVPMTIVYITETGAGPFPLSGGANAAIQASLTSAPKLDILIVPGILNMGYIASDAVKDYIKSIHVFGAHVLSICTGILAVAASGILDGEIATSPLDVMPIVRQWFPAVKWQDARRWEKVVGEDGVGDVWTSGSVLNGVDLAAAFLREKFAKPAVEVMIQLMGVSSRARKYSESEKGGIEWTVEDVTSGPSFA